MKYSEVLSLLFTLLCDRPWRFVPTFQAMWWKTKTTRIIFLVSLAVFWLSFWVIFLLVILRTTESTIQVLNYALHSQAAVVRRLLCISVAVVTVAFLTAAATLVLALFLMLHGTNNMAVSSNNDDPLQGEQTTRRSFFFNVQITAWKLSCARKEQTNFKLKKGVIRFPLLNDYTCELFLKIMLEFNDHWETELIPRENDDLNGWVYEYFNFQMVFKRRKLQWMFSSDSCKRFET